MLPEILNPGPECTITTTRTIPASIELVFHAWTEPEHLARWWGPAGFTNTFHEHDLRPGGRWRFTMHGPEAGHYENECVFIKIEAPVLIAWYRISKPLFQVLAKFESLGPEQTKVTFNMLFETEDGCNKLRPFVPEKNEENMDRLEAALRRMATAEAASVA